MTPSDQLNSIQERDPSRAQGLCCLLNSIVFISQFFLLKEESTGRYIDLRLYDLYQLRLVPDKSAVSRLVDVFEQFADVEFESLRHQFDKRFDERYQEFWRETNANPQASMFSSKTSPISPSPARLEFDLAVLNALQVKVTKKQLLDLYNVFVKEMIVTLGLARD